MLTTESKYHVISCSYPNVTLSKTELHVSDPYDQTKEVLKVTLWIYFMVLIIVC